MQVKYLILFLLLSGVSRAQIIGTIAGNGTDGDTGDGGMATNAEIRRTTGSGK